MPDTAIVKSRNIEAELMRDDFRKKFMAAIPNNLNADRLLRLALIMIKASDALLACSPVSIMACVMESGVLGLEFDPLLGQCYMVSFQGEATLIIGYRGFCRLMYQSAAITAVSAEVVRKDDGWRIQLGTQRGIHHIPAPIPKNDNPEEWKGAYAVAKMLVGDYEFEFVEQSKIITTRNRSRSYQKFKSDGKQTAWVTDSEEMWRKTAIRRLAKRMPVSTTDRRDILLRAVMLDEYGDRKDKKLLTATAEGFVISPEAQPEPEPPLKPTEDLTGKLKESIDVVNAQKNKPGREKKKPPSTPPKAEIPKLDDAYLTSAQQTTIYNAAIQAKWQIPEAVTAMLKKEFKVNFIREARNSQFKAILERVRRGA